MSFTRIPNKIIDELKLNPYQFQIFTIIVRKTDGWCKVEDGISLSQFEKLVTFKKPKIISTLKELEELQLIVKIKNYNEKTKQFSFSVYKISEKLIRGVVTEDYKGSNSELQGVVTEDYIQKKLNTKETNTKNITPTLQDINTYIIEKSLNVDGKAFYDYFSISNWIDSKGNKVKNWKQKLLTWNNYNKPKITNNNNNRKLGEYSY